MKRFKAFMRFGIDIRTDVTSQICQQVQKHCKFPHSSETKVYSIKVFWNGE
jgi:hypothetical protein